MYFLSIISPLDRSGFKQIIKQTYKKPVMTGFFLFQYRYQNPVVNKKSILNALEYFYSVGEVIFLFQTRK